MFSVEELDSHTRSISFKTHIEYKHIRLDKHGTNAAEMSVLDTLSSPLEGT